MKTRINPNSPTVIRHHLYNTDFSLDNLLENGNVKSNAKDILQEYLTKEGVDILPDEIHIFTHDSLLVHIGITKYGIILIPQD